VRGHGAPVGAVLTHERAFAKMQNRVIEKTRNLQFDKLSLLRFLFARARERTQELRREADMIRQAEPAELVENDPKATAICRVTIGGLI
jgi:hypothetical protein